MTFNKKNGISGGADLSAFRSLRDIPPNLLNFISGHAHLWSADQQNLHRISIAEYTRESYTPRGIDVGIDFSVGNSTC